MHNGCLLLLAFVAVFQPIASYSERGLVDGRQQRCDYRTSLRDPELYFHGTYRFSKPAVEDRRLSQRENIREVGHNEVKEESLRSASDRRLVDTLERNRITLARSSRDYNDAILRREIRESRLVSNFRDNRNQDTRLERLSRVQETHQAHFPSRQQSSRLTDNGNRYQSRLDEEDQRVGENRETRIATNRAQDDIANNLNDRRIARERVQRMDTQRSVSRIQVDRNAGRELLARRSVNREFRSSSTSRAYKNTNSRLSSRDDTRKVERDDSRSTRSRRSVNEQRELSEISRIQRQSLSAERRNTRESSDHRNLRKLQGRIHENRVNTQLVERARSTERQTMYRDSEGNARLIRAVRSVDDRISQNDPKVSRIMERSPSVENRRETQANMNNRIAKILRDTRSMETDSRIVRLNLKKTAEIRGETRNNNRDSCTFDRQRSTETRMSSVLTRELAALNEGNSRKVDQEIRTRVLDRATDNRRDTLDIERTFLVRERQRVAERKVQDRRDGRNLEFRASRVERTDRSRLIVARNIDSRGLTIDQSRRDIRNVESRVIRTERTDEYRRDIRNVEFRAFKTERADESRRDIRNVESRALLRTATTDTSRREIRNVESRAYGTERAAYGHREARDFERRPRSLGRTADNRLDRENNERDARLRARTLENRQNIRNTERTHTEDGRIINNRRATRSLNRESRSFGRERAMESRVNKRSIARDFKTERATENRREASYIQKKSRTYTQEDRRVESIRSRGDLTERKNDRASERRSQRDLLDSRRTSNLQRELRRENGITTDRDIQATRHGDSEFRSFNTDFGRNREFQTIFRKPTQTENETPAMNWQFMIYTLQGIYICGVLMQLMNERTDDKKNRASWWSAPQHLIKVD